jgi:hypothetical protein
MTNAVQDKPSDDLPEDGSGEKRIQIVFDEAAMRTLDEVKQAYRGKTATATVIRDALGFFSWAQREIAQGNKVAIIGSDGRVREVVLPFQM